MSTQRSYQETRIHYQNIRDASYRLTRSIIGEHVRVEGINFLTAELADNWHRALPEHHRPFVASWSWSRALRRYRCEPSRFEISVWSGANLCGLALGKTSEHKKRVRLDLVESTPVRPSPLNMAVFQVISIAASFYGRAIGAEEVCLLDPVNDHVSNYYQKFGYSAPEVYFRTRIAQRKLI